MAHSRQAIVDKINSWLGCHEGDATHHHIIDTYNAHQPLARGYKVKYTDPWCATTVSAAAIECGYTDIIPTECSCNYMIKLLQQMGIWVEDDSYSPKPGDIIMYDWDDNGVGDDKGGSEHTGIVVTYPDAKNQFIVTEGNKNDGVNQRTMTVNGKYIRGYGVPKYDSSTNTTNNNGSSNGNKQGYRLGLDVSSCQSSVDFTKVKQAGYDFVILRSTTKNGQIDTKFEQYYTNAKNAKMDIVGVYKYSYALNPQQSFNEAVKVVDAINGKGKMLTIWLDLEDKSQSGLGKQQIEDIAVAFLDYCQSQGYGVGIYTNLDWWKNRISDNLKNKYKFWIARYGKNTGKMDVQYKPNVGETIWQYTSKGVVSGVSGNVDLNVMYK